MVVTITSGNESRLIFKLLPGDLGVSIHAFGSGDYLSSSNVAVRFLSRFVVVVAGCLLSPFVHAEACLRNDVPGGLPPTRLTATLSMLRNL